MKSGESLAVVPGWRLSPPACRSGVGVRCQRSASWGVGEHVCWDLGVRVQFSREAFCSVMPWKCPQ